LEKLLMVVVLLQWRRCWNEWQKQTTNLLENYRTITQL
jgi:hypothetical protein